jgi:hypothetical protein
MKGGPALVLLGHSGDGKEAWPAQAFSGESSGVPSGRGDLSAGPHNLTRSTAAEYAAI